MEQSPAFKYGVLLGNLQRAYIEFGRALMRGFRAGGVLENLTAADREHQLEHLSVLRYERRVQEERRKGLEYVRKRSRRLEEELGLQRGPEDELY